MSIEIQILSWNAVPELCWQFATSCSFACVNSQALLGKVQGWHYYSHTLPLQINWGSSFSLFPYLNVIIQDILPIPCKQFVKKPKQASQLSSLLGGGGAPDGHGRLLGPSSPASWRSHSVCQLSCRSSRTDGRVCHEQWHALARHFHWVQFWLYRLDLSWKQGKEIKWVGMHVAQWARRCSH